MSSWKRYLQRKIARLSKEQNISQSTPEPRRDDYVAEYNYSSPLVNQRMQVSRIVFNARYLVKNYLDILKSKLSEKSMQKRVQVEVIEEMFDSLFIAFLDSPTFENGTRIENYWYSAVPILQSIEPDLD